MIQEAIILCGGLGTRLRSELPDLPKAMAPIKGRPFIEYQFDYLISEGVTHVVLATGHLSNVIEDHYMNTYRELKISYSREYSPLGTGGATQRAAKLIKYYPALVLNGDTYAPISIKSFFEFHKKTGGKITIALKRQVDSDRYGSVKIDYQNGLIVSFKEKENCGESMINSGIYLIENIFKDLKIEENTPWSLEQKLFDIMLKKKALYGFVCVDKFIDIGIPQDYARSSQIIP